MLKRRIVTYFKKLPVNLKKILKEPVLFCGIVAILVFLVMFVLFPLFKIFQLSFVDEGRFSLKIFQGLMAETYNRAPFVNSIILGFWVAIIGTVIGFFYAYAITRVDLPWKKFFKVAATFPIIAPPFMMSLSMILLFGR
ncbi:MAG: iron ABC transporter permease, partial [Bacillota bacterium]